MARLHGWLPRLAVALCAVLTGIVAVPGAAGAATGQSWAVVSASGALARGNGATGAIHLGTGTYEVDFARGVRGCAYVATAGDTAAGEVAAPVETTVASRVNNGNGVLVQTFDQTTGRVADEPFHLTVSCGSKLDYAVIAANGTTARGAHVVSSTRLETGHYQVIFDHDVSQCAFTATLGTTGVGRLKHPGEITVTGRLGNVNGVFVDTEDRSATVVDTSFHLAVDCGGRRDIAVVNGDGSKARGRHVLFTQKLQLLPSGTYEVVFDRNVTACSYTATIGETYNGGGIIAPVTITTASLGGNVNGVFVFVHNVNGATQDEPFHLTVTC